jgi:hypothetical protein
MTTPHNQTYIEGLVTDLVVRTDANALVLAENGDNQLGRRHPHHAGYRIWNGNLCRVGHHNKDTFVLEANAILPGYMFVDRAHHEHAHLEHIALPPGYDDDPSNLEWVYCAANANGAVPVTVAITQTRDTDEGAGQ